MTRIESTRRTASAAVITLATAMAGTLMWTPAAVAQDPTPSPPTALSATETGGVAIHKKDSAGAVLAGATFTLFDSAGQQVGTGITDADGQLAFKDLAPGVYRLKEVSKGRGFAFSEGASKPNSRVVRPQRYRAGQSLSGLAEPTGSVGQ